ncbi:MAG TPA: hypothetical protein VGI40_07935 [Pirellulaceae bacterium]|jgi:hypothetical protein
MNGTSLDLFRQAAEAEGGISISAGARIAHVRAAIQSGRALYVDLSAIPEDKRGTVVEQITAIVNRATAVVPQPQTHPSSESTHKQS